MNVLYVVLRLIHIISGVVWVGFVVMLVGFVVPNAQAMGAEGGRFVQRLTGAGRLSQALGTAAPLTVLAGLILYWLDFGFRPAAMTSRLGLGFTAGGLVAIIAMILYVGHDGPVARRAGALQQRMAGGGAPTGEQMAEMRVLQEQIRKDGLRNALLLVLALVLMATARYL